MATTLSLEVSLEQIAEAVHRMDAETRATLIALAPELGLLASWATTITYESADQGYLARCMPLDVVAWGATLAEVKEELIDAVIETAVVIVEAMPNPSPALRQRLPYARTVYQERQSRHCVATLLGLSEHAV